jgi:hypothetical protein
MEDIPTIDEEKRNLNQKIPFGGWMVIVILLFIHSIIRYLQLCESSTHDNNN